MVDRFATVARLTGLTHISLHDLGLSKAKSESEWVWKSIGFQIFKKNCLNRTTFEFGFELSRIPSHHDFIDNFNIVWCWKGTLNSNDP